MVRTRRLWIRALRDGTLLKLDVIIGIVVPPCAILIDALSDPEISTDTEDYCRDWHDHPNEDVVSSRVFICLS